MSDISSKSERAPEGNPKRPKQLKLKRINSTTTILWRYFAFFALGVITVIALVCYGILGNTIMTQEKRRVRSVGEDMALTVSDVRVPESLIVQKIADYSLTDGVDVFIFSLDGGVLAGAAVQPEKLESLYASINAKTGEWEDGKKAEFSSREGNKTTFNYAACVRLRGQEPCKLLVRYPVSHIAEAINQIKIYVLIVSLAAFLIAFFISFSLANKLSGPIRNISGTAKKLAAGDYDVQFNSAEYAEIATLSDTLNYMKDEIKKSDQFQKELLANVSHDLKTPLTMIKAYASMIQEISGDDPEKRAKHLQVIIDESDRLTGLVNDILSTSKITAGLDQLNKKVFNLTELLYGVINKFSYLQETQGYNIMVDVESNLYTLADEEQIYQVIYNLISNAVNYTGEDKTVYVSLKFDAEEQRIKFAVRDTGKGIAEDELAHIWDRYYRSKDSHLRPVKGTGLGLNIVKVILQKHAFNFGVNTELGEGSVFFVDLPLA
ncbi:MAG: HAMP domain-containing histidine kinase [Clostridia bacterium]|nr:HAMP domain-containing histidine kinase [Clostridia bacterium]